MYKEATVSCSSEGTGDLRKLSSAKHSIEDSDLDVDDRYSHFLYHACTSKCSIKPAKATIYIPILSSFN